MEGRRHKASIIRDKDFKPRFAKDVKTFTMADLLFFAADGKKEVLNSTGGA